MENLRQREKHSLSGQGGLGGGRSDLRKPWETQVLETSGTEYQGLEQYTYTVLNSGVMAL